MAGLDFNETVIYKLGQIESKMDQALTAIKVHQEDDDELHNIVNKRVTKLENWRYWVLGAAGAVSVITSAAALVLGK